MKRLAILGAVVVALGGNLLAQAAATTDDSAEGRVRELYELISVEPGGETPDWDQIRTFFLDEAVVFMRTSREESAAFTLDQWIADFVSFIDEANVAERGFTEKIIRTFSTECRDVAEVMVLYEASFPTSTRPAQQGVDMIHLARVGDGWRIVSIVNDIPENPDQIPAQLRE